MKNKAAASGSVFVNGLSHCLSHRSTGQTCSQVLTVRVQVQVQVLASQVQVQVQVQVLASQVQVQVKVLNLRVQVQVQVRDSMSQPVFLVISKNFQL